MRDVAVDPWRLVIPLDSSFEPSLPGGPVAVVRVLVTGLQPTIVPGSPRFSERLLQVPVTMGWRSEARTFADLQYRHLCGHGVAGETLPV